MADNPLGNRVNYAGVMSTAAALGAAALLLRSDKAGASTPPFELPPELIELLMAEAADVNSILQWITAHGGAGYQGWPPNADYPYTGRILFPLALTPVRLPFTEIQDDFALVVKAHPVNPAGSIINVARDAASAINVNAAWPLIPNESIAYKIKQAEEIWVASTVGGGLCSVVWTVELRR